MSAFLEFLLNAKIIKKSTRTDFSQFCPLLPARSFLKNSELSLPLLLLSLTANIPARLMGFLSYSRRVPASVSDLATANHEFIIMIYVLMQLLNTSRILLILL